MNLDFACRHRFSSGFELDVDFRLQKACVVLIGPSGSGKTSILSMIAGVIAPDHGAISIAEKKVFDSIRNV